MNIWKARTLAALTTALIIGLVILGVAFPTIGVLVLLTVCGVVIVSAIYQLAMLWWHP